MRLICPNCDAQYEVPDDVIPAAGRDVQCSNCANTWFFKPVDPTDLAAQEAEAEAETQVAPPPPPAPEPHPETPPPAPQPERRALDPAVADVLREEAEYEARARANERAPLETQADLGLDDLDPPDEASRRSAEARARMARMRGEAPDEGMAPAAKGAAVAGGAAAAAGAVAAANAAEQSRRGLLPNVDEINSTLRADEDRTHPQETEEANREHAPKKRGGFWRGFLFIALLVAIAVAVYIFAPQISEAVPQVADPLGAYVAWVDGLRGTLDRWVLSGLATLDGLSSEVPAADAESAPASE